MMKAFLRRIGIFTLSILVVYSVISFILLTTSNLISNDLSWFYVYKRIIKSSGQINSDTLYIGDSVGNQFYNFKTTKNSLTANSAILMSGHYILAANAIKHNPGIKHVVLLSIPNEIGHKFERKITYNNFVKPFFTLGNQKYIDTLIYHKLYQKPWSLLTIFRPVKLLPLSDIDFSDNVQENKTLLSDISLFYLKKLKALCLEKEVTLQIVSPPVQEKWKGISNDWYFMKKQIHENELEDVFSGYFENITYLPQQCFKDPIHLRPGFLRRNYRQLKNNMYGIMENNTI